MLIKPLCYVAQSICFPLKSAPCFACQQFKLDLALKDMFNHLSGGIFLRHKYLEFKGT